LLHIIRAALRKFIQLDDTPNSYSGLAGKLFKVNSSETALEPSTNTDSEIADAVNKKHTQNTDHIIKDADADTFLDVEESADKDEIVGKVAGVEALRIHNSGIIELPKQSVCRVYMDNGGSAYPVSANTWTKVPFDTKNFDNANEFDTTNHRFIASESGFYIFLVHIIISSPTDQSLYSTKLYKNGSGHTGSIFLRASGTASQSIAGGFIVQLAAGDYIEVFIQGATDFEIGSGWGTSLYVAKIA